MTQNNMTMGNHPISAAKTFSEVQFLMKVTISTASIPAVCVLTHASVGDPDTSAAGLCHHVFFPRHVLYI
jgi:hypothetical protein